LIRSLRHALARSAGLRGVQSNRQSNPIEA
jgi:hypothetical protein